MPDRIRARYVDGNLELLDPLRLPDGCNVLLEVAEESPDQESSGSWLLDLAEELHSEHPPERWENRPTDFVRHKKHHLYGHPKHPDD
ncbi:MAG: DUF104 domain-containing protein [Chloroflexi bacterium]|nr:DUF104 domain-containing protein [Chloroflexota bacterium]MYF79375.1 DUF104 domain-containing protein [Chloroflexota bacterium]